MNVSRFWALCGGLVGFLVVSVNAADPSRDADAAVDQLTVYPGLEAVLFASEPLIASPTNIDVDDRGRVWVCEVQNYRGHGARDQRPEGDRILILEDTNGDGVSDRTKVFYQGRDIDAALGLCVFNGRVVVTCAPSVILFTDEDGDDRPDAKSYLFTETGRPQSDHSTHSFVFGPDGHFYWNMGNSGAYVHDAGGHLVYDEFGQPVVDRRWIARDEAMATLKSPFWGGMVFRCDLDGSHFEVLGHNFRNNYEVTVDSFGNPWQSDNDDDGNYGVRLNYIMEYGNYGYLEEYSGASWKVPRVSEHPNISARHWHQNDPGVVPNLVHTGAGSPTGITVYEGTLLPERFWGQVLHCDAGPGVLWAAEREAAGAGFQAKMVNVVKAETDRWFRPVDVAVAPDGSLFLSDWYDPVVGWNRQADLERGRIFRIAPKGHKYDVPKYDFESPAGIVAALKSPAYSVRARAWQAARAMGRDAEDALLELARSENPWFRARALWLLAADEDSGQLGVDLAIRDGDARIRLVGLRSAVRFGHPLLPVLRVLAGDESPAVRRECATTLPRVALDLAPTLWAELAEQFDGEDRWYLEALGIGAAGRWDECLNEWLGSGPVDYRKPAVRQILWRSRSAASAGHLARMLRLEALDDDEVNRLLRAFDFQPKSGATGEALLGLVKGESLSGDLQRRERIRTEAFQRWASMEAVSEAAVVAQARELVSHLFSAQRRIDLIQRYELDGFGAYLLTLVEKAEDEAVASSALRALFDLGQVDLVAGAMPQGSERWVKLLAGCGHARANALLLASVTDDDVPLPLRELALRGLIQRGDGARTVLDMATAGKFPGALAAAAGSAFTKTMNVAHRNLAAELFPVPALKNDEALPQMTELLVYVGDVEKGRQIFESATCAQCHALAPGGSDYGPNLSGIGAKLSKQGLYESILDPNASVSPSYQGVEVNLRSGDVLTGLLVSETDDTLAVNLLGEGLRTIPLADVESHRLLAQSVMPAGLQQLMSFNDLVDLVEFLAEQRSDLKDRQ